MSDSLKATTASQSDCRPADSGEKFNRRWSKHLHLVDLDGARSQQPVNQAVISTIRQHTPAFIELGGGIRTLTIMDHYLNAGN